jgi:hypothetical protein
MSQSRSSAWAKMVTACSVRIYVHLPLSNNVYNCHTHTHSNIDGWASRHQGIPNKWMENQVFAPEPAGNTSPLWY